MRLTTVANAGLNKANFLDSSIIARLSDRVRRPGMTVSKSSVEYPNTGKTFASVHYELIYSDMDCHAKETILASTYKRAPADGVYQYVHARSPNVRATVTVANGTIKVVEHRKFPLGRINISIGGKALASDDELDRALDNLAKLYSMKNDAIESLWNSVVFEAQDTPRDIRILREWLEYRAKTRGEDDRKSIGKLLHKLKSEYRLTAKRDATGSPKHRARK